MNINARFETLFNAKLDDIVYIEGKSTILEPILLEADYNDQPLFMTVEQGSGKHKNDIHVVLNPKIKNKVREWIVEAYPTIAFRNENDNKTSVNPNDFKNNTRYNESLKEFLSPILTKQEAGKMKKYIKKTKTYTQALQGNTEE